MKKYWSLVGLVVIAMSVAIACKDKEQGVLWPTRTTIAFNNTFGVFGVECPLRQDEKAILRPVVEAKVARIKAEIIEADASASAVRLLLPPTTDPHEAQRRIFVLGDARYAHRKLNDALGAAKECGITL